MFNYGKKINLFNNLILLLNILMNINFNFVDNTTFSEKKIYKKNIVNIKEYYNEFNKEINKFLINTNVGYNCIENIDNIDDIDHNELIKEVNKLLNKNNINIIENNDESDDSDDSDESSYDDLQDTKYFNKIELVNTSKIINNENKGICIYKY